MYFLDTTPAVGGLTGVHKRFFTNIWVFFLRKPMETLPPTLPKLLDQLKAEFDVLELPALYDFLEYIIQLHSHGETEHFIADCNGLLERLDSPYRLVAHHLALVTDPLEREMIETVRHRLNHHNLTAVRQHLMAGLTHLSHPAASDYHLSVQASTSAVAGMIKILTGKEITLGQALNDLEVPLHLNRTLVNGLTSLHGYAHTSNGTTHALLDDPHCGPEEARYMLVASSAFINYLIEKALVAGIRFQTG